jgi:hypothetical protein
MLWIPLLISSASDPGTSDMRLRRVTAAAWAAPSSDELKCRREQDLIICLGTKLSAHPPILTHMRSHAHQGILKGEVSLYRWPPVWLVWNQLYDYHRYRKAKIDCLSFVMCPLLAQLIIAFFFLFLLRPFTVLFQQTRQAVRTIKQSIYS